MNDKELDVVLADLFDEDGMRLKVTARGEGLTEALNNLYKAINDHKLYKQDPAILKPASVTHDPIMPDEVPPPPEEDEFPFDGAWDENPNNPANQPAKVVPAPAVMGRDWGLVKYKPKASELTFGDRFSIQVDEFKFDGNDIKFYQTGSQFQTLQHNMKLDHPRQKFEEVFKGWNPPVVPDRTLIPGGSIILDVQCTGPDKSTTKGNPYQNLDGMRRA